MKSANLFELANKEWDAGNKRRAFDLFRAAAARRQKYAYNSLGYFYDHGYGTRRNKSEAIYWYRRGARVGDVCAISNLALCYRDLGNRDRAKFWLLRAIQAGDGDAQVELAKMQLSERLAESGSRVEIVRQLRRAIRSKSITPAGRGEAERMLSRLGAGRGAG